MTYFKILGPLEVVRGDELVDLGGTRQRAALGLLLLNRNRVVASSQMVDSLWPKDKVPLSARKIVQNSVWRLRRALSADGSGSTALLSQPPGYILRVEPGQTDVQDFHHKVEAGRARFAEGDLAAASQLLKQALELWRGPALADLIESGILWPELTPVQNARLDALEDYFEVELCRGHHQQILAELERTVATEPLRERLCGQLMLALYRSGRQTDALNAYYTVRTTLVEKVGLEPSPALRSLQQAILTQDPGLIPVGMQQQIELRMTGVPRDQSDDTKAGPAQVRPAPPVPQRTTPPVPEPDGYEDAAIVPAQAVHGLRSMVAERRNVSALIVRCQGMSNTALERASAAIREGVESLGGSVAASIGSIWLALFGVPNTAEDDAERAVLAALTIRDCLGFPDDACYESPMAVHVAVATGEVLVRYHPDNDSAPSVSGVLLDECHGLLSQTPVGEIRVCDNTRRATECAVTYVGVESSFGWQVGGLRQEYLALHDIPVIDREHDLEVLRGLLHRARHLDAPHLVTVLGDPGVGKTRFVLEFERKVTAAAEPVRVLLGRARRFAEDSVSDVLNELLCSYCGIDPDRHAEQVRAELVTAVERLVQPENERRALLTCLAGLSDPERAGPNVPISEVLRAWAYLLSQVARYGPVVVVVEDLHVADDLLVDFVEELPKLLVGLPVLVVVTAQPDLVKRRPMWGSRLRHTMTMNLEPISDTAIDRLVDLLRTTRDSGVRNLARILLADTGDDSDARRRHVRRVLASGASFLRRDGGACDQDAAAEVVYCEITEMPAPAGGGGR